MAAAAMLAGCSRNEIVEQNPENAISFDNSFVNNMTKATDVTLENLTDQTVYGVYKTGDNKMVYAFQAQKVAKDGTYSPIQYWLKDAHYWFTAIAPNASANWNFAPVVDETVANSRGVLSFNNETAQAEEDLLMVAPAEIACTSTKDMQKVALDYGHQLSRVKFNFTNTYKTSAYQLRISDIHITNAISEATMNIVDNASAWVAKEGTARFDIPFAIAADQINVGKSVTSEHMYLIPNADNDGAEYNITFTIERMQYGESIATYHHNVNVSFEKMEKGHSYVLSTEINEGNINPNPDPENPEDLPIEFTIDVEDWMDWETPVLK